MSPGFFLFIREIEIRSKQMGYDSGSRQQERIANLGHKTKIRRWRDLGGNNGNVMWGYRGPGQWHSGTGTVVLQVMS